MAREPGRPDPDALLARIKAQEKPTRGRLRIYLGAAAGVGKTYTMLEEAHRRKGRGTDVVIGWVETHGRVHTAEQISDLEIVPPREIAYRGVTLKEMDVEALLRRHPQVALVDELAHTNVPGSTHEKRYQDVLELLDAGIMVIATLNIQHIESLNDTVQQLTGVPVRETIPDRVVNQADEIELIDMSPRALIRRMKHGNIYPPEQARWALDNFFTVGNLAALRDLALRATAREVEDDLSQYMWAGEAAGPLGAGERIMVAVDHRSIARTLIQRGWRMAAAFKGALVVVHVEPDQGVRQAQTVEDERRLRAALQLADELGAQVVRLRGKVADELMAYARAHNITHIVIGHPTHSRWEEFLHGSVTNDILRKMRGVDVHVSTPPDQARRKVPG
jgi:two-component system, OmpR family, sensor histidine kinase KdpD